MVHEKLNRPCILADSLHLQVFPMKSMKHLLLAFVATAAFGQSDSGALTFRHAIELSLQHATSMAIAAADTRRAQKSLDEQRYQFIPQLTAGSGLAATYGFPLSLEGAAPTAISVNTQSSLLNFGQLDFIKSARSGLNAANLSAEDRRQLTILDAASSYIQLDTLVSQLTILKQQQDAADHAEQLVTDRVHEGVDAELELTRAKLAATRVRMRTADAQGAAEVLRSHLAALTGLRADQIATASESIPAMPALEDDQPDAAKIAEGTPSIKAAFEEALSKQLQARGEKKMALPTVDLVGQYGLLTRYNNYDRFFKSFQRNNVTFGVAIRIPIFNQPGRAHAAATDAAAVKAKHEAEGARQEMTEQTLQLRNSIKRLQAAREVAKLDHQISQSDVATANTRVDAGLASFKDQEAARIQEHDKYLDYLDADFALQRTQLQYLRMKGGLEGWALATK
jgi:outer membrane protein TolC